MKFASGTFLVAIGLVVVWLAATGRLARLGQGWKVVTGGSDVKAASLDGTSGTIPTMQTAALETNGVASVPYGIAGRTVTQPNRLPLGWSQNV